MPLFPNWRARRKLTGALNKAYDNERQGRELKRKPLMTWQAKSALESQIDSAQSRLAALRMDIKTAKDRYGFARGEVKEATFKPGSEAPRERVMDAVDRTRKVGRTDLRSFRLANLQKQEKLLAQSIAEAKRVLADNK
jgi:hypothetical protein